MHKHDKACFQLFFWGGGGIGTRNLLCVMVPRKMLGVNFVNFPELHNIYHVHDERDKFRTNISFLLFLVLCMNGMWSFVSMITHVREIL